MLEAAPIPVSSEIAHDILITKGESISKEKLRGIPGAEIAIFVAFLAFSKNPASVFDRIV